MKHGLEGTVVMETGLEAAQRSTRFVFREVYLDPYTMSISREVEVSDQVISL